jgi:hypothetical protein
MFHQNSIIIISQKLNYYKHISGYGPTPEEKVHTTVGLKNKNVFQGFPLLLQRHFLYTHHLEVWNK